MRRRGNEMKSLQRIVSVLLVCFLICGMSTVAFADNGDTTLITNVPATVTFQANGGRGTMETVSLDVGTEYTLPRCGFIAPRGKIFQCWEIDSKIYEPGDRITVNSDITVKALWRSPGSGGNSAIGNVIQTVINRVVQIIRNIFSRWF